MTNLGGKLGGAIRPTPNPSNNRYPIAGMLYCTLSMDGGQSVKVSLAVCYDGEDIRYANTV